MASTIAGEVLDPVVLPLPAEEDEQSELRELQFQGLWARVELEALFAAGLVTH